MRRVANRDVLPMRRASLCTAAFGMLGLLVVAPAAAQDMMQHVDLTSPEMTAAEMTRAEVEAAIAAATSTQPADFTGKKLSGLDLSGLDLSGTVLRAARLNGTKLTDAKLDRAVLELAALRSGAVPQLRQRSDPGEWQEKAATRIRSEAWSNGSAAGFVL